MSPTPPELNIYILLEVTIYEKFISYFAYTRG